ncbi:MAG: cysteine desulfurase [Paludibacteraceae bacterium]|nr:cysteine desulfurase [Paludibacteraceae bacterium]
MEIMLENLFPILTQQIHGKKLVYLDNAATTQKPVAVIEALNNAYTSWNANVHRGVHYLSQVATRHHEEARQKVADFLGAKSSDEIIFTKGTTDSINMLAFSFGERFVHEGDEIIVSYLEHHSNIVPWQMLCERKKAILRVIPLRDDLSVDIEAFESLLSTKTRLISIAHVSNVLGIINPIRQIIQIAHRHNVPVSIDAAQSVPHIPVNVQELDCDFLSFSAHKMYGPTGIGVLYGKQELLNQMVPYQGGGEMINHVRFEQTTYNTLPYKFEAGTPDFVGSYGLAAAIDFINQTGRDKIARYEEELTTYMEQQLAAIDDVVVYAAGQPKAGAVSFNVGNIHPFDIGTLLDQQGIAVRTGHHCAEPLIDYLHIPGTVRASVAVYNNKSDIDLFISALKKSISMLS